MGGVNGQIDRDETGKAKIVVPLVDVKEVRCLSLSPGIGVFASRRRLGLGSRWWILRRQEEALFGQQILVRGFQARPVIGGVFIKMLDDPAMWKKWVTQGKREGPNR